MTTAIHIIYDCEKETLRTDFCCANVRGIFLYSLQKLDLLSAVVTLSEAALSREDIVAPVVLEIKNTCSKLTIKKGLVEFSYIGAGNQKSCSDIQRFRM